MKLTDIFIRRPVLAICVNLLILVGGYQAIDKLPTRQYPKSDLAVVIVKTIYVGANADLVRGFITTPLERVIASADGIDYLESASQQGLSTITAHLRLNYDTNDALTQIQSKVNQVRNELPPEAEAPIIDVETSDNRFASMYMSFYSQELAPNQITDYLMRVVQPKLSAVPGVQKADILGARTFAMRVWLKPERMAALKISAEDVGRALEANNYLAAIGNTKGSMLRVNLVANTDLKSRQEFEHLVIKHEGNTLVRLGDISDIVLGAEDYDSEVRFNGEAATFMGIWVLPNANSLEVIRNVRAVMPDIEQTLPAGLKVKIPYDATKYINDAIHEVLRTLSETVLIVIVVIFLFIGSLRSVLVPVVAIPLSLIGGVGLMYVFGFTLNLLTLLAIVLSVGLVVDDAIVVLENVERHVTEGQKPFRAAILGARELFGPIVAMTITLAAVYAPIGFQGGLTGALFREFAFTLAGAVVISGIVALTLSPMMASRLVRPGDEKSWLKARIERGFGRLQMRYESALRGSLRYRPGVLTAAILIVLCIFPFYLFSTKELAPREDQGVLFSVIQAAPNASLDQTLLFTKEVHEKFEEFPEHAAVFQITTPQGGFAGMVTSPWGERSRTTQQMEPEAWGKLSAIPGLRVIVTTPPPLPGGSNFPVEFILSSTARQQELYGFAQTLVKRAFESGMFMFADTDLKFDLPQSRIVLDRDKIASLGMNLAEVGRDLSVMLGGNYINRFNIEGRSYKVIPQAKRVQRLTPEHIMNMYVTGPGNKLIPVSTFASLQNTVEPRQLNRFQQLNSVMIQGAVASGTSIDAALRFLEEEAQKILPQGYTIDYAGESRQLRKEGSALVATLILSILIIYLVLAAQFESFRDPFIILAGSVPLALAGALAFVFLDATSLNIYSQVGLVTLVGLVAKNGILIVEFANKLQEEGYEKREAVLRAASIRLRPVLMTTAATIMGHLPLILATGAGAGARNSIGMVLVTGMFIGTVFTLFAVPAIYTVVASRRHGAAEEEEEGEHMPAKRRLAAVSLASLIFTGCMVGPDYKAPELTTPEQFIEAQGGDFKKDGPDLAWWRSFGDPMLERLIVRAVENNHDIEAAVARVNQARALAREAYWNLLPTGDVSTGYTKNRTAATRFRGLASRNIEYELYDVGFDALWELDVFGRIRREAEAQSALSEASKAGLEDALRILVAETARTYIQLRSAQGLLDTAIRNAANQQETLTLAETKEAVGEGGEFDTVRVRAQLQATRSLIPPLSSAARSAEHRLAVLCGVNPGQLGEDLATHAPVPLYHGAATISDPASILQRRPDLRAAERTLAAATAGIGVAVGEYFPRVTFSGTVGVEAPSPDDWFRGGGNAYNYGPRISWPILDLGRIHARVDAADEQAKEALALYEQAVLNALAETEDALAEFSAQRARRTELQAAVQSSRRAFELAQIRYRAGSADLLSVLESQRDLLRNEGELISSEGQVMTSLIAIYKALGGGWEEWSVQEVKK